MQDLRETNDEGQSQELLELSDELKIKYPERPRLTKLPYGYRKKVGDPNLLVPDPVVIPLLDSALDQLDAGISLRVVAEWLNATTPEGTNLSHEGLKQLRYFYRPDFVRKQAPRPKIKKLTHEEILAKRRKHKIAQEKKRLAGINKRIAKYKDEVETIQGNNKEIKKATKDTSLLLELDYGSEEFKELEQEAEIIFKPNPGPQTVFFSASEREVLYGGAAGGGKSYALIADPMRYFDNPNFRGIIFRRTNDELRELMWKSKELYTRAIPGSIWREKDKEWRFPSGATLWMTYLEREEDVLRYQGQAFTYIGFDELTQYPTPFTWNYMRTRLRDASKSLPLFMRATSNPGGPGHGWVKRMFIDPAPYGKAFDATNIETNEVILIPYGDPDFPAERWGKPVFQRRFIPAKLSDNPYLNEGGEYKANLLSQTENLQRQLLDGDWNVADGAAFSEFRANIHTIDGRKEYPNGIPTNWKKFRSCDFGYSERQASAVHWYAIHPATNQLIVYRELYVNKHTGRQLAQKILELERNEQIMYGVLDSSVWSVRGQTGPSIAEEMIQTGCRWRPSDRSQGSRVAGKNRLHELLRIDPINKLPGIVFFDTCRQIISDLPVIPADKDSDDIDDKYASDHAYDSIRYGIMSRPKGGEYGISIRASTSNYRPASPTFGY